MHFKTLKMERRKNLKKIEEKTIRRQVKQVCKIIILNNIPKDLIMNEMECL